MKYTDKEKQIATLFLSCKIPDVIYNNECNFENDAMEYYEALFDYAHCILADTNITSNFSKCLENEEFYSFLTQMDTKKQDFYNIATRLLKIVERHIIK